MKKIILIFTISFMSFLFIIYVSLAGYLKWSELKTKPNLGMDSLLVNSKEDHEVILINSGLESLKRRVMAIDSAKLSIELEYFIFELDLTAQLISTKLIEASKRGVKVKVLVDTSAPVFKLTPEYAQFLTAENIQVKYYNSVPITDFINVQHRSHRKFLIIDSEKLITGGRNIGDDYFDLSAHYNFLDSDIEISGPIVKDVQESFLSYWNSSFAIKPEIGKTKPDPSFLKLDQVEKILNWLNTQEITSPSFVCSDIDFVTDSPGVDFKNRKVWPYLVEKLKSVEKSIDVESPYFVLKKDGLNLMKNLAEKKVKQTYLTNSLYSTDAYYTVSAMLSSLAELKELKTIVHLYSGNSIKSEVKSPIQTSHRWGLHAKRAVLDGKHTLIGTYNIDPRSANLNSEVLFACNNNDDIANATLKSMISRRKNSWKLFNQSSPPMMMLTNNASLEQIFKFYLIYPIAWIFNFLL